MGSEELKTSRPQWAYCEITGNKSVKASNEGGKRISVGSERGALVLDPHAGEGVDQVALSPSTQTRAKQRFQMKT